jgi:hypothetical protein
MDIGMMMVFASYGWDSCPDDQVWERKSDWRGSPPTPASTCCGLLNTILTTTPLCPTTST